MSSKRIYYLSLNENGLPIINQDEIIQAKKNSILKLEIYNGYKITNELSLISNIHQNIPSNLKTLLFNSIYNNYSNNNTILKEEFSEYILTPKEIFTSITYEIELSKSGSIFFCFLYSETDGDQFKYKITKPFYIIVSPEIYLKKQKIKFKNIHSLTVLSKSIGKIYEFDKIFQEISNLKYNFIHFTPIQQLGETEFIYSIKDLNEINDIFFDKKLDNENKLKLFEEQLIKCNEYYGLGTLIDIVLKHCSINNPILISHPECGYNLVNTPWLTCAYELDNILQNFSFAFCNCTTSLNFQPYCRNEDELNEIINEIKIWINNAKLYEYFLLNEKINIKLLEKFYSSCIADKSNYEEFIKRIKNTLNIKKDDDITLNYLNDNCLSHIGESRYGVKLDFEKFGCYLIEIYNYKDNNFKRNFIDKASKIVKKYNNKWKLKYIEMLKSILDNIKNEIRFFFTQNHGKADKNSSLIVPYFFSVNDNFTSISRNKIFACDGWTTEKKLNNINDKNFLFYFERKVTVWRDCIKLNYGNNIEDCPFLINYMTTYIQSMAKIFNGFILYNIDLIPISILEYLIEKAREINPDLLIVSDINLDKKVNYINRLGINLLIQQLISCNTAEELANHIKKFNKIRKNNTYVDKDIYEFNKNINNNKTELKKLKYLKSSMPKNIIFDLTQDNVSYFQKANDLCLNLTYMSCNSFSDTAIGSTFGFDQLFPLQPSSINEKRKYALDKNFNSLIKNFNDSADFNEIKNIKEIKTKFLLKAPNAKIVDLALSCRGWFPDVHLKKIGNDFFSTEISLPVNEKIYYKYIVNHKIWMCDDYNKQETDSMGNVNNVIQLKIPETNNLITGNYLNEVHLNDLKIIRRELNKIRDQISLYKIKLEILQKNQYIAFYKTFLFNYDNTNQIDSDCDGYALICRTGFDIENIQTTKIELPGIYTEFVFGVTFLKCDIDLNSFIKSKELNGVNADIFFSGDETFLKDICYISQQGNKSIFEFNQNTKPNTIILVKYRIFDINKNPLFKIKTKIEMLYQNWEKYTCNLNLNDINLILYKCDEEELSNTNGIKSTYTFDSFGPLIYAGISQIHKILNDYKFGCNIFDNETEPVIENIKSGDWFLRYSIERLKNYKNIKEIYDNLNIIFEDYIKLNPSQKIFMITKIIDCIYNISLLRFFSLLKINSDNSPCEFNYILYSAIPQFIGNIDSSKMKINDNNEKFSLAAGLPYNSSGNSRNFGRDTFVAFKGIFLITGLFNEAKKIILSYASTMKYGLISNKFNDSKHFRYDSRDVTWLFLKSIIDYIEFSNDNNILNNSVKMVSSTEENDNFFPKRKRSKKEERSKEMYLYEIIQEILQKHINGINFKENNSNKARYMKEEGFNINIYVNTNNGFVYGGNKYNCGTWMNIMGTSDKAKNKGYPANPRDGADIEIIALVYYVLTHLDKLNREGKYKYNSIKINNGNEMTFFEWAEKIKKNFEKYFFVFNKKNESHEFLYKDYISIENDAKHEMQLRPNVFLAMATSPELFNKQNAINFIKIAEKYLIASNKIGIRTLDYTDEEYSSLYDLRNDGYDYQLAHGFNLHNGALCVWIYGYYLLSKLIFNEFINNKKLIFKISQKLTFFQEYIKNSKWSGLPGLIDNDGEIIPETCETQLISIGVLIEVIDKLSSFKFDYIYSNTNIKKRTKNKNIKKNLNEQNISDNKDLSKYGGYFCTLLNSIEEDMKEEEDSVINKISDLSNIPPKTNQSKKQKEENLGKVKKQRKKNSIRLSGSSKNKIESDNELRRTKTEENENGNNKNIEEIDKNKENKTKESKNKNKLSKDDKIRKGSIKSNKNENKNIKKNDKSKLSKTEENEENTENKKNIENEETKEDKGNKKIKKRLKEKKESPENEYIKEPELIKENEFIEENSEIELNKNDKKLRKSNKEKKFENKMRESFRIKGENNQNNEIPNKKKIIKENKSAKIYSKNNEDKNEENKYEIEYDENVIEKVDKKKENIKKKQAKKKNEIQENNKYEDETNSDSVRSSKIKTARMNNNKSNQKESLKYIIPNSTKHALESEKQPQKKRNSFRIKKQTPKKDSNLPIVYYNNKKHGSNDINVNRRSKREKKILKLIDTNGNKSGESDDKEDSSLSNQNEPSGEKLISILKNKNTQQKKNKREEKNKNKEKRSKSKSPDNKNRVIYTPEIIEHFNNIKNQSINMNINTLKPEPPMFGENNIYKKPLISLKESRIVNKKDNNKNYYPNYKNFDFFENDYSENKISSDFISPIKIMNNDKDTQILTMPIANFNSPTKKKEKIKEGEGLLKLIDIDEIVKKRKKIKKSKKNGRKMTPDLKHVKSKQKLEENSKDYGKGKINKIIMTEDNEKYIDYSGDNDREGDEFDIVNTVPQNIIKKNRRYSEKRKDNS